MNKDKYPALQIAGIVAQAVILILVVLIFVNLSSRIAAIEQKQVVLENHLEVLRSDSGH